MKNIMPISSFLQNLKYLPQSVFTVMLSACLTDDPIHASFYEIGDWLIGCYIDCI
jgi:hypothetical protein